MELIQLQGYFLRTDKSKTTNKTIFTEECLKDIREQIKHKKIYLMIGHSDDRIGELTACSLDKKGLKGSFVLYQDHPLFFKVGMAILWHVFVGFSVLHKVREAKEIKDLQHLGRVEILNVALVKKGNNPRCVIEQAGYDNALEILLGELKDLEGRDFFDILATEGLKKTRRKDYGI